jgi:ATP-dependent protease ClpP protease subunit
MMIPKPKKTIKPERNFFDFTSKQTADSKSTQLELHLDALFDHGVNFRDRVITISSEIDEATFLLVDAALSEMEAHSRKAITIRINSGGGTTYDALAIVGRVKSSKCKIITEGYGCIMSAATLILACGKYRRVSDIAWFMVHESSYLVEGKHKEHREVVRQMEREENQWAECMARFSNNDAKYWRTVHADKDTYFSAQELLGLGVVDEVF